MYILGTGDVPSGRVLIFATLVQRAAHGINFCDFGTKIGIKLVILFQEFGIRRVYILKIGIRNRCVFRALMAHP